MLILMLYMYRGEKGIGAQSGNDAHHFAADCESIYNAAHAECLASYVESIVRSKCYLAHHSLKVL